jgi:hypothetical protein
VDSFIVMIEGLIAFAITSLAWRRRRFGPTVPWGMLLGVVWCAFLHGLCFGVLRIEGPNTDRDPMLLAGFGLVTGIFAGIPLGAVLGVALGMISRSDERRVMQARETAEKGPG